MLQDDDEERTRFLAATISKRKSLNEIDAGETESERRVLLSHPMGEMYLLYADEKNIYFVSE